MFLLDTNIASLLFRSEFPPAVLLEQMNAVGRENIYLCSITHEEFVQGALSVIRQAETKHKSTVSGYLLLTRQVKFLAGFPLLEFDTASETLFQSFPAELRRAGNRDCKIAACGLQYGATVITQNLRHFQQVPHLSSLDWTQPLGT
ncbi:PIN domain-containing protein [Armatimonas sp.]|uniref:type II toxin-antitoxin system VapC family toxin n=1 Tax=Armatimonas sp. TaxID=1872638 RepID=UPI00286BAF8E|nr:PIN domain-containing protein [Armatimonas sp.]